MQKLSFFSKDINSLYTTELDKIINIANSLNINHIEQDWQIDNEVKKIMLQFWEFKGFTLNKGAVEVDNGSAEYSHHLAADYLNKSGNYILVEKKVLFYATYKLPLSLHFQTILDYGEKDYVVSYWGELNKDGQPTVYIFSENPLTDTEIAIIKEKKENLFRGIEAGVLKNTTFYENKKNEAQIKVGEILRQRYEALKTKKEINSKL